jgi:two-component system, OmpR family, sensor kinase
MRIRSKILLSHFAVFAAVALVCLGIVIGLSSTESDRRQLFTSYEQLRSINLVAADANRYSEQIAEMFILGGQQTDIVEARDMLMRRLAGHRELIEREHFLAGEPGASWGGLDRVDAMFEKVALIDATRQQIEAELNAGNRAEAERLFSEDIEHRLDRTFAQLIEQATRREQEEVEGALASSARLSQQSIVLALGLVGLVATLAVANVIMLNRSILRPIEVLHGGAEAVGRGDLGHRVHHDAPDELGALSRSFNQMTAQIGKQRNALLKAKSTLAEQVEARTLELREQSEKLARTNERLRAIDTSRVNFFADISHELRTPLTILRGQAEVALRAPSSDADTLRSTLSGIVKKAEQLGRLVDDLLFLARSEAGSIMVRREEIVFQDVIGDVLIDGQHLPKRSGVRIRPSQPEEPVVVLGDPERLRQAIFIALDNAIRLAPEGTTVELELVASSEQGVVRIRDQGPGFTSKELGSAFTRFYSARPSRPRSGRGLGLGLAIAKWIVEQHDGAIRIDSTPDHGATVEISVPLLARAAA